MNWMDISGSRKGTAGKGGRATRDSHPKMYEGTRQRFRQIMAAKQFLSTIKYVSGTKPAFLLSEIAAYLDEPLTIGQIHKSL